MCVSYLGIGERDFGLARIAPSYQLMVFFWFLLSFLVCFFFGVAATAGSSLLTQPLREESGNNKEEEEDDENLKKIRTAGDESFNPPEFINSRTSWSLFLIIREY